jgi:hypothetical protein
VQEVDALVKQKNDSDQIISSLSAQLASVQEDAAVNLQKLQGETQRAAELENQLEELQVANEGLLKDNNSLAAKLGENERVYLLFSNSFKSWQKVEELQTEIDQMQQQATGKYLHYLPFLFKQLKLPLKRLINSKRRLKRCTHSSLIWYYSSVSVMHS